MRSQPRSQIVWIWLALTVLPCPVMSQETPQLSSADRSALQYHFQNLFNEEDLIVRNHRADLSDIRKQERNFAALKVFERIPFHREIKKFEQSLRASAQSHRISLGSLKFGPVSPPGAAPPKSVWTDAPAFRFTKEQLVEKIFFEIRILGSQKKITNWIHQWPSELLRIIEIDREIDQENDPNPKGTAQSRQNQTVIQAHIFRFRKTQFPRLKPRNPLEILPLWAQKNPEMFSKSEKSLWRLIVQIQALAPHTKAGYQDRGQLLLNNARMDFFLSKTNST